MTAPGLTRREFIWFKVSQVVMVLLALIMLRYYLLWADPKFGLPRLEAIPSPFEAHSRAISQGAMWIGLFIVLISGRIGCKKAAKEIQDKYAAEDAERERRLDAVKIPPVKGDRVGDV